MFGPSLGIDNDNMHTHTPIYVNENNISNTLCAKEHQPTQSGLNARRQRTYMKTHAQMLKNFIHIFFVLYNETKVFVHISEKVLFNI